MPTCTSTISRIERADRERDRRREIRDRLLASLAAAGRPMTPLELARRTGLGVCAVSLAAVRSPTYFEVDHGRDGKRIELIARHHHLTVGA